MTSCSMLFIVYWALVGAAPPFSKIGGTKTQRKHVYAYALALPTIILCPYEDCHPDLTPEPLSLQALRERP